MIIVRLRSSRMNQISDWVVLGRSQRFRSLTKKLVLTNVRIKRSWSIPIRKIDSARSNTQTVNKESEIDIETSLPLIWYCQSSEIVRCLSGRTWRRWEAMQTFPSSPTYRFTTSVREVNKQLEFCEGDTERYSIRVPSKNDRKFFLFCPSCCKKKLFLISTYVCGKGKENNLITLTLSVITEVKGLEQSLNWRIFHLILKRSWFVSANILLQEWGTCGPPELSCCRESSFYNFN